MDFLIHTHAHTQNYRFICCCYYYYYNYYI